MKSAASGVLVEFHRSYYKAMGIMGEGRAGDPHRVFVYPLGALQSEPGPSPFPRVRTW